MTHSNFICLLLIAGTARGLSAQSPESPQGSAGSVIRHADVFARTVVAVMTDGKGKPLSMPPSLSDLIVTEDGEAVTLLSVEPVRPASAAMAAGGAASSAPVTETARRVRQVLYVDATLMRITSVKAVCEAMRGSLPTLLAAGPLEIVVANPSPKVFLAASSSAEVVGAALTRLGKEVAGKDLVANLRRSVLEARAAVAGTRAKIGQSATAKELGVTSKGLDSSLGGNPGAEGAALRVKNFADEENVLVEGMLRRLEGWASSSPELGFGILYLATDGFDVDQSWFYSADDPNMSRHEVAPKIPKLMAATSGALIRRGWVAFPIGLGAVSQVPVGKLAEDSSLSSPDHTEMEGRTTALMHSSVDPLRDFASATGGEVIVSADRLTATVTGLSKAYAVSYQVARAPDGKSHRLSIKSNRPTLRVHAAESVAAGTLEATATARAWQVLAGDDVKGELPVTVAVEGFEEKEGGRIASKLAVRVKLASIRELVTRLGGGRMRISIAVEVPGGEAAPHHEEMVLAASGLPDSWLVRMPLVRPQEATRVAVVAEELVTGVWGTASSSLLPPPPSR